MIKFCVKLVQRWLPEPFIFAIILTLVAAGLAMPICRQTPVEVIEHWGGGVWNLLAFAMQMSLVLVCGSALASAPAIKRGISALASIPKTPPAAIALVTATAAIACWLNWGFGLIVGVIFAKEIARKLPNVDYRLLIASAYSGFVVWHAGLSGSIPLTMATPGEALTAATNGILTEPVPVSQTILNPYNLLTVVVVIVAIVVTNALMHPKKEIVVVDPSLLADTPSAKPTSQPVSENPTPAQRMEQSRLLSWIVALIGFAYLVIHLGFRGGAFDLGSVIMLFLFLGVLLHGTPLAYVRAFTQAATGAAGIILQFPFYAGIMGI
ncbi:MAG: short-chain fatty acid transporter, partial [Bacteroidales bacterium]|nr:short-chain fatty acid transporter [Bacteroidales bacterium]